MAHLVHEGITTNILQKKIKNPRHTLYISYQYTVSENKLILIGSVNQFVLQKCHVNPRLKIQQL